MLKPLEGRVTHRNNEWWNVKNKIDFDVDTVQA